jgi:hypothetical protein
MPTGQCVGVLAVPATTIRLFVHAEGKTKQTMREHPRSSEEKDRVFITPKPLGSKPGPPASPPEQAATTTAGSDPAAPTGSAHTNAPSASPGPVSKGGDKGLVRLCWGPKILSNIL